MGVIEGGLVIAKSVLFACVGGAALLAACTDEPLRAQKMFGPVALQNWAQQDQATNVQDWHRIAVKIADQMQNAGLLAAPSSSLNDADSVARAQQAFFVRADQDTPFARELSRALGAEILRRQGVLATSPSRAHVVEVGADVVIWGSRLKSDPGRIRAEGIWFATLKSQDRVLLNFQEPFYIFPSDVPNYVHVRDPGQHLARSARPLQYAQ
ncbi:hypothetical protein [Roseomonas chloroacetimidivorans]|uniref:hypothetical protein n=1 Tax=Roseomonas chloroacetimidivorans TaxID=1766656 RepID=UPI003C7537FC